MVTRHICKRQGNRAIDAPKGQKNPRVQKGKFPRRTVTGKTMACQGNLRLSANPRKGARKDRGDKEKACQEGKVSVLPKRENIK